MKKIFLLICCLLPVTSFSKDLPLEKIKLPKGFSISIFAKGIENARSMAWGKNGTLFVGTRNAGRVYGITPKGEVHTIAKGLNYPNGVAIFEGDLYVAEIHRLIKFENIELQLEKPPEPKVLASFPKDTHHGWKFIAFGPDGKLYVPQGAPCNICELKDPYGTIATMDPDGKNFKVYARGIRNTVGFDWHPLTRELWFTDNGRDHLGDDSPPDELNSAPKANLNFGYPYCHAGDTLDPDFGKNKKCEEFVAPKRKLGPHVAALGMRFYSGGSFPKKYFQQIFIAEHGSWNRSKPLGYRIMSVSLDKSGNADTYETFAEGWLDGEKPWGRPVDVIVNKEGDLLVSDDHADVIYKISYKSNPKAK